MKKVFFTLVFIMVSTLIFAQLIIKEPEKAKTVKPKTVKPPKKENPAPKVNTASYIVVFRGDRLVSALTNYSIFIDGKKVCKLSNGKYFKYPVSPGKHEIEAKKAGMDIMKKEIFTSVISTSGRNNYVSCNVKSSLLKEKVEMIEVLENSGKQSIDKLKEDNCQTDIDDIKRNH